MQTLWGISATLGLALLLTACVPPSDSGNPVSDNPVSSPSSSTNTSPPTSNPITPAPTSYKITLKWNAPSARADGSPLSLSDISGYRVYYLLEGTDSSQDTTVPVNGGTTTSLSLTLTAPGSYTFAITAVDLNGLESGLSSALSIPIN